MTETTEFRLLETVDGINYFAVTNSKFATLEDATQNAQSMQTREARKISIERVVTTRTIEAVLQIPPLPKLTLEEIAAELSSVYAQSIDWRDEDFLALSAENQAIVRDMVNESTDDCENCGWTFETDYLCATDHGTICDRCERELAEEEDDEDD